MCFLVDGAVVAAVEGGSRGDEFERGREGACGRVSYIWMGDVYDGRPDLLEEIADLRGRCRVDGAKTSSVLTLGPYPRVE